MHMLRLRLLVDYRTEPIVEKRFRILAHISNQLRKHVKKQLSRLNCLYGNLFSYKSSTA